MRPTYLISQVAKKRGDKSGRRGVSRDEKRDPRHPRSFLDPLDGRRKFWADEIDAYDLMRESELEASKIADEAIDTARSIVKAGLGQDVEQIATAIIRKKLGKDASVPASV
jgi:hypothetical protein